jgi:hypothetical protein
VEFGVNIGEFNKAFDISLDLEECKALQIEILGRDGVTVSLQSFSTPIDGSVELMCVFGGTFTMAS